METLIQFDQQLFNFINQGLGSPILDSFFVSLTDFTKSPMFFTLLPVVLLLVFKKFGIKGLGVLFLAVVFSSLADFASSALLKTYFARSRPEFSSLPYTVILRRPSEGSFSFPSSHALDAFLIASFVFYYTKSWGRFLLILAALMAFSRVYVGLHFPSDVIAGSILGIYLGYLLAHLSRLIFKGVFYAK